jgi:hypothetical protein
MRAGYPIPPEVYGGSRFGFFATLVAGAIIILALLSRFRSRRPRSWP